MCYSVNECACDKSYSSIPRGFECSYRVFFGGAYIALAAGVSGFGTNMALTSAHISTRASSIGSQELRPEYYIYPTYLVSKNFEGCYSGDWQQCGFAAQQRGFTSQGCQREVTVSEQIGGSVTIPVGAISGAVGFDVSYSQDEGYNYTVSIPPGEWGAIGMGFEYAQYYTVVKQHQCNVSTGVCSNWRYSYNTVQDHIAPTGKFFPYQYVL
jgi:hypothetical protein